MNRTGFVLFALLFLPRSGLAECLTLDIRTVANGSAMVFSGTVTKIEPRAGSEWGSEVVTFDVDRAWKGSPRKEFVIYNFMNPAEPFIFSVGTKYLVFAHRQTPEERAEFGFPRSGRATFGVRTCGDGTRIYANTISEIGALGAGRAVR